MRYSFGIAPHGYKGEKTLGKFVLNMPCAFRGYMKHKPYLVLHVEGVRAKFSCGGALYDSTESSILHPQMQL